MRAPRRVVALAEATDLSPISGFLNSLHYAKREGLIRARDRQSDTHRFSGQAEAAAPAPSYHGGFQSNLSPTSGREFKQEPRNVTLVGVTVVPVNLPILFLLYRVCHLIFCFVCFLNSITGVIITNEPGLQLLL